MFKSQQSEQVSVLGVCLAEEPALVGRTERLDYCAVRSGRRAVDMMRLLSFDLVLVGLRLPDANPWEFVRRVRTGWAWQKWALVGGPGMITDEQERTARMFGAVRVYDVVPSSDEVLQLAAALRERAAAAVLDRTFVPPALGHDLPAAAAAAATAAYRPAAGF